MSKANNRARKTYGSIYIKEIYIDEALTFVGAFFSARLKLNFKIV